MSKLLTTVMLLALSAVAVDARQQPAARLADQFGEIQWSDWMARLDNFAIQLQNEPDATGHVVAYAATNKWRGWPARRAHMAVEYLTSTRRLDATRLAAVSGGLRDETRFELWVVPAGAGRPVEPFDLSLLMSGEKSAVPFDRFSVIERGDRVVAEYYEATPQVDDAGLYAHFAEVLRLDPSLRGCVIGHTSRRGSRADARRLASRAKLTIAKSHAIDVGRVVALGGDQRDSKLIEVWLVPPGAALPKPTPDPRPRQRRRRPRR